MSPHRRVGADGTPVRIVVVGAGGMGRMWLSAVAANPRAELVGVADLDVEAARAGAAHAGLPGLEVAGDVVELAARTGAQAVVDVTVPAAHHPVTTAALFAGLPVLGEKPAAETVVQALSLAAAAEVTGELFMVSQSRRWNPQLAALRGLVEDLGAVGTLTTEFFRAPRFGGFREQMAHPLLVDMAIHAFDSARFLLSADAVSAYCETYNPSWSWYAGDAAAAAVFEMERGIRYSYTGSWCSPGAQTSWNGSWRVSGEHGSAAWDGERDPVYVGEQTLTPRPASAYSDIAGALEVFLDALASGERPSGDVHDNVGSLLMVEAAVRSASTGSRVQIEDVLQEAHVAAVRDERRDDVRAVLEGWPSPAEALRRPS